MYWLTAESVAVAGVWLKLLQELTGPLLKETSSLVAVLPELSFELAAVVEDGEGGEAGTEEPGSHFAVRVRLAGEEERTLRKTYAEFKTLEVGLQRELPGFSANFFARLDAREFFAPGDSLSLRRRMQGCREFLRRVAGIPTVCVASNALVSSGPHTR